MKNFLKLALIAIIALVNNNVFAQEANKQINLYALKDKLWSVGQSLDGQSYKDKDTEIEVSFSKGEGTENPIFIEYTDRQGNTQYGTQLEIGNTITITSYKHTIKKVEFGFSTNTNAAKSEKKGDNYEFSSGKYEKPTWTGSTGILVLKNVTNKQGFQIRRLYITYLDGVSGIEKVTTINVKKDNKVYDLSGNYISNDINTVKAGIYVVNGKKVVKK